jgi:hypothetical protein
VAVRDVQQQTVYKWEGEWEAWVTREFLTVSRPRELVRRACKRYRVPPPVVKGHHRVTGGTSFYEPNLHRIELRKRHWNVAIALHEAAHAITDWLIGPDQPAHGPEWMAVYLDLLATYKVAPRVALEASARAHGIRWSRAAGPREFKRLHKRRIRVARRERENRARYKRASRV